MDQSARLRLQDLRDIHRLVGECRELGDSATAWRSHLVDGAIRLAGAGVGLEYEVIWRSYDEPEAQDLFGAVDRGWDGGYDRAAYEELNRQLATKGRNYTPMHRYYTDLLNRGVSACVTRADIVPDREWYRSDYYRLHRAVGTDAIMYMFHPLRRRDAKSFLILVREAHEPDFAPRARTIVWELHSQVAPLIERELAGYHEPSSDGLAPRARQVLRCLLEGDGDKQISARLGLSRHTVNFYVRQVFAHFGVTTRSELMARWIRRGWRLSSTPIDAS